MHGSATAIWIICVVVVAGLAIWLVAVTLAARKPNRKPHGSRLLGPVQGEFTSAVAGAWRPAGMRKSIPTRPWPGTPSCRNWGRPNPSAPSEAPAIRLTCNSESAHV
jgi:hypothetical protein